MQLKPKTQNLIKRNMKKQDTKPVKLEKEYNQYDLTDVFMRGLYIDICTRLE